MKIEIWSDVMCPFCYIGKKNFENALEELSLKDKIDVEWKSFQLDPSLEMGEAITTAQYFKEKKGFPENQAKQMTAQVTEMGKSAGIDFNFEKAIITNTFQAHKLIHLAKKNDLGSEMEEELFKTHFLEGKNIGDSETLINLGKKIDLDSDMIKEALSSKVLDLEVKHEIIEASQLGISGVPFFVINQKYGVSGAQPVETFKEAITQAYNESSFTSNDNKDLSCSEDDCSI
ncbi:Predicted dithiol-disulfide isomerase, DsbA family [Chryseobacterium piscicola]|uniref:Disulfide bond formation protein DsbA n=2 Tax=Chryseobacterium TaxID=59732 RepID=A0A1N7LYR3_9FLAO|nr:DsbA family oxidoreductase [Chryseobacterium piscicola]PQA94902.1 disulfide bond formation protein DsbA [Chryseobacterium piscicola]SIS78990.1 Predicted dithiol-disulfide isomerase, DsbA family [Chryseobacterium piscicola]